MMSCTGKLKSISITARPSPEEKARFAELATSSGLSEAALALKAIRSVIGSGARSVHTVALEGTATDRITIRLRPGDGEAIGRRAAQRDMRASRYIATLVRAHLSASPPLATNELVALKQSVLVLAGIGRLLAKAVKYSATVDSEELRRTRLVVAALEQRVLEFAKTALISWESRIG